MQSRPDATPDLDAGFRSDESFARQLDARDPLSRFRDRFHIPVAENGEPTTYLAGNSLGLQPKAVQDFIDEALSDWARLGVDAHFKGRSPWYRYHEFVRESAARLVGADPREVVMMNSLTVNLHLMMVSFYRPDNERYKIVMEDTAFPSDTYAVRTQLRHHGIDPADGLLIVKPSPGEHSIAIESIEKLLADQGDEIALVLLGGVNFLTGQCFDMERIAAVAKERGCTVGYDLAHAAGNVPLRLHDWGVDFAVWCTYKYLNCGPGAVGGCFVHERHGRNASLNRFAGWWGNDPDTRFRMHLLPEFTPTEGADGWQISNPPILAMAPLRASFELFDEATMSALRTKSELLTGYLEYLLDQDDTGPTRSITPRDPQARGCQLSIVVPNQPADRMAALKKAGVVCDFREPDVIRVAPVPLYNTFHEVWNFARILSQPLY